MNKEQVITVLIGLLVGTLAVCVYFGAKNFLPKMAKPVSPAIVTKPPPVIEPPPVKPPVFEFTLNDLTDHSSTTSSQLNIRGKTIPGASVLIYGNADEKIASADASGNFGSILKLEDGENELSVTAFANGKNSEVIHRNITLEVNP